MKNKNPKILIGTLYSGENELDDCIKSVEKQNYTNWNHKIFRNLPNKEAHDTLYSFFMNNQKEYELFIKLDADMVFKHEKCLEEIVKIFQKNKNLDHLVTAVHDFFSDSLIMGLHVFSNRVRWQKDKEEVFVDPDPWQPGEKISLWDSPAPLVLHNSNPDPVQAYSFGIHRMTKAIQKDRKELKRAQVKIQWGLINKLWQHFERTGDKRLGLAIIGADEVLSGQSDLGDYKSKTLAQVKNKAALLEDEKFIKKLHRRWNNKIYKNLRFYRNIIIRLLWWRFKRKTKHLLGRLSFLKSL